MIRECSYCGEPCENDDGEQMCAPCFAAATLELEHEAGNHDEYAYFDPKCRSCNGGVLSAAGRKRADELSYEERRAARGDWMRQVRKEEGDR